MADMIRVNTELLDRCANELKQAARGFDDAASILAGLNTGEEWWTKMGRFQALTLQDEGGSVQLGDAGAAVRSLTATMRRYNGRMTRLGDSTARVASMFDNLEHDLSGKANSQDAGETPDVGAVSAASGTAGSGDASRAGESPASASEKKSSWWDSIWWAMIKGAGKKIGPAGALLFSTIDAFKNGAPDGWDLAKYACEGGKAVAKWFEALYKKKKVAEWFGFKYLDPSKFSMGGEFVKQVTNPINVIFSGASTFVNNYKEFRKNKISGDRAVVEWGAEWAAELAKTAGITAAGGSVAVWVAGAAGMAGPPGWLVLAGTAAVAGTYCGVDWAYKKFVTHGERGIVQDFGHFVGERYDADKARARESIERDGLLKWGLKTGAKVITTWTNPAASIFSSLLMGY